MTAAQYEVHMPREVLTIRCGRRNQAATANQRQRKRQGVQMRVESLLLYNVAEGTQGEGVKGTN